VKHFFFFLGSAIFQNLQHMQLIFDSRLFRELARRVFINIKFINTVMKIGFIFVRLPQSCPTFLPLNLCFNPYTMLMKFI